MKKTEWRLWKIFVVAIGIFIIELVAMLTEDCDVYAAQVCAVEDFTEESSEAAEKGLFDANSAMPCCDPEGFAAWYETYTEEPDIPIYRIAGESIDADLQRLLYHYLSEAGIEYWYTGALAQMFQESHCRQYAENPNGLDKGIYQFRTTYWNWSDGDIFDVDAQIRRYVSEMAARFNAGLSVDEAISRHKTSDYVTTIDWTYVGHVKQWLNQMEAIR